MIALVPSFAWAQVCVSHCISQAVLAGSDATKVADAPCHDATHANHATQARAGEPLESELASDSAPTGEHAPILCQLALITLMAPVTLVAPKAETKALDPYPFGDVLRSRATTPLERPPKGDSVGAVAA
jgi:hypothetical protein